MNVQKPVYIFFLVFFVAVSQCFAERTEASTLEIYLENADGTGGIVIVRICANNAEFDNIITAGYVLNILPVETYVSVRLPHGKYAIEAFQDHNGNKILDKEQVGTKKEQYGYSRKPQGITNRKPSFNEASFIIKKSETFAVKIKLE